MPRGATQSNTTPPPPSTSTVDSSGAAILNLSLNDPVIIPSPNNIDYLAHEQDYVITQEAGLKVQSLLNQLEFVPNQWVIWMSSVLQQLEYSFLLSNFIQEDPLLRELMPIRFHRETEERFLRRVAIYKRRKQSAFLAISNHVLSKELDPTSIYRQVTQSQHTTGDPLLLLDKLRATSRGSRIIEQRRSLIDFSTIVQLPGEQDPQYIVRANQLLSNLENAGGVISHELKLSTVIGGISDAHAVLKQQLAAYSPEAMAIFTLDLLLDRLLESRGSMSHKLTSLGSALSSPTPANALVATTKASTLKKGKKNKAGADLDDQSSTSASQNKKKITFCEFCGYSGHEFRACRKMLTARAQLASNAKDPSGVHGN